MSGINGGKHYVVITTHIPKEIVQIQQWDETKGAKRPCTGAHLVRPFPEARILFIDHVNNLFYVYWIDHRLALPQGEYAPELDVADDSEMMAQGSHMAESHSSD